MITKIWRAIFYTVAWVTLLLADPVDSVARPSITKTLSEGNVWILNVNGEQSEMVIGSGKRKQTSDGKHTLKTNITWKGRKGGLRASVSADNKSQNIYLFVTTTKGKKIECKGSAAYSTDNMMAGICDEAGSSGAWYALLKDSARISKAGERSAQKDQKKAVQDKRRHEITSNHAELERNKIQRQLSIERNKLKECRASLSSCVSTGPKGVSTRTLNTFKNNVTGTFEVPVAGTGGAGGAADSTQVSDLRALQPKVRGENQDLINWLNILRGWSSSVIYSILSFDDRREFAELEDDRCKGDIFCQIALEQQTIACALGAAGC